jgi:hypothetical protein
MAARGGRIGTPMVLRFRDPDLEQRDTRISRRRRGNGSLETVECRWQSGQNPPKTGRTKMRPLVGSLSYRDLHSGALPLPEIEEEPMVEH